MATTTLRKLRDHNACDTGYAKLLAGVGESYGDDTELPLLRILETNGPIDTIWALRAADGGKQIAVNIAIQCAESVLSLFEKEFPDDGRPRMAIEAAKSGNAAEAAEAAWAAAGAARAAGAAAAAAGAAALAAGAAALAAEAAWAAAEAALAAWAAARAAEAALAAGAAGAAAWAAALAAEAAGAADLALIVRRELERAQ